MKTLLLQNQDSLPGKICPDCGSYKIRFDSAFGFCKCESCGVVWASDKDDPDYDDIQEEIKFHNNKYTKELYPDTPDEPD